ncbi:MAG: DNA polymerase III [Treponema sp.]|jgi:DNA polymerase-3 subunit gamma/tau|nr:DNA polymerase III [Treponema sp.]
MFDHILGQPAVTQLSNDITEGIVAPSMLFAGPSASGKGTTALELGRIRSCENPAAPEDCTCHACDLHRLLSHPDLLILGPRAFSGEIAAATAVFLNGPEAATRLLFIRSVRKLLTRFSPVLWEDDPKIGKLSAYMVSLEEDLDTLGAWEEIGEAPQEKIKKCCDGILKTALKLESEGIGDLIPIAHIRRAAYWSHLAPTGRGKLLLIENADHMQEGARNSLLKILEEPPESLTILLTTSREKSLLPTILSRLRPYRFTQRTRTIEAEVIRRVFRDARFAETLAAEDAPGSPRDSQRRPPGSTGRISAYLDAFLPVSGEILMPLAAFFIASVASATVVDLRNKGDSPLPEGLVSLGAYTAPIAEAAGLGRPLRNAQGTVAKVLAGAENFEVRALFSQFLNSLLTLVSESLRQGNVGPGGIPYTTLWGTHVKEALVSVGTYNQAPALALDRLYIKIRQGFQN